MVKVSYGQKPYRHSMMHTWGAEVFASPSMAAMALMGRSANGWVEWKAASGRTLDELKRQVVQVAG